MKKKLSPFLTVEMFSAGALIGSSLVANVLNFLYTAYLGRGSLEEFGLISLISSFLFLTSIPLGSLSKTVIHQTAFILGKHKTVAHEYWARVRHKSAIIACVVTIIWVLSSPLLAIFFQSSSITPFLLFAPIWVVATLTAVDKGFLAGSHKFFIIAAIAVLEPLFKLLFAWMFVSSGNIHYVYAAVPLSTACCSIAAWMFARHLSKKSQLHVSEIEVSHTRFSKHFFFSSVLTKISGVTFLSMDLILAKHFLTPAEAGLYAFICLVGNIIYYIGDLFGQFMTPVISKELGAAKNSKRSFYILLLASITVSTIAYIGVGIFGFITVPILFGEHTRPILFLLPIYGLAMLSYTIANNVTSFYQIHKKNIYPLVSVLFSTLQITGIAVFHNTPTQIVWVMTIVASLYAVTVFVMHLFNDQVETVTRNLQDFWDLLWSNKSFSGTRKTKRILIFNWRDTRHIWAGGAEVYIHEIAKRLVLQGYQVTLFCGNDGRCPRNEVVDGVQVIRRGGFYTVYIWAALYYILRFRGLFDVVIDSQNGIPFFTPFYVRVPIIALIYHVHQEVFNKHLIFPFAQLAMFLEAKVAPLVYKKSQVITISESTKMGMKKAGLVTSEQVVSVITPGIDKSKFTALEKTAQPSILYFGRLKPYKSVDTAVRALKKILPEVPNCTLIIAGEGESRVFLEKLVRRLGVTDHVLFTGKVSESKRAELMAKAWVVIHPSLIEGWGITNIEANASGTPVVAADVAGLRDSVRTPHTGFLVQWGNEEEFAAKILLILKDHELRHALERGAKAWSEEFSWDISAQQVSHVVEEVTTK